MPDAQLYFLSDQYYIDFPDDKLMKNKDIIDENILVSYGEDKRKALRKYTKYKHLSLK